MQTTFIPFHRPTLGQEEIDAVTQVLASKWLTTGTQTHNFEHEFAAYLGCKYALAVNSCTAALQLALDAIDLKPGDEVLVPSYTFTATAEVVTYFGARPVLCDSIPGGFNLDPTDAAGRITPRTRAIIPVHIAGDPCDLKAIHALASRHNLTVIEDAAHALPASFQRRRIGGISDMTAFSFYATKTITTGEGGMLTTNQQEYAHRASLMRLHGISGDAWKRYSRQGSWHYEVLHAGYKLNMSDIQGALGLAQLKKSDEFWSKRRAIASYYKERFSQLEQLELPPEPLENAEHAWHLFIVRIRPELLSLRRNAFIDELKELGIGTSVHFIPLHLHPFYQQTYGYRLGDLANAENAYERCISLPIYPDLSIQEMERVADGVEEVVQENRVRVLLAAS